MAIHTLVIDRWAPARLNQSAGYHWSRKHKQKKFDRQLILLESIQQRIPKADGKRQVNLYVEGFLRGRLPDPDSFWKSLLDGLVGAGLLIDDSQEWCEMGRTTIKRSPTPKTIIVLEDITETPENDEQADDRGG